jgi:putative oxidoreductase
MFSSFPDGAPGLGLLLLRAVLGVGAISSGVADLVTGALLGVLDIVVGSLLLAGFLTPVAAILLGLAALNIAFSEEKWTPVSVFIVALATALLGPGAFSIDARLFGRREIIIPVVRRESPDSGIRKP